MDDQKGLVGDRKDGKHDPLRRIYPDQVPTV